MKTVLVPEGFFVNIEVPVPNGLLLEDAKQLDLRGSVSEGDSKNEHYLFQF
ncbi:MULTISPECIES: hypothetical protein [unclassified Mesotoga]|uniref:hypothetical protein n=1 Tax=unclassified Mesotoga TaxID=1184398 RepID=UPI000DC3009F|nr:MULTISPECIES: hypothetical protein [unclassified Mesotoga]RAO96948.1 hypothetical protein M388_12505 [Mesotoga sp. Brook.08.YT.4.2.5.4.]